MAGHPVANILRARLKPLPPDWESEAVAQTTWIRRIAMKIVPSRMQATYNIPQDLTSTNT